MGSTYATKLRYYEQVSMDPGIGAVAFHSYAANGCYDPNLTGVGHQPRGFDQLMTMYNHFLVVGSKISVNFVNTDPNIPAVVGIQVSTDPAFSTSLADYMEQGIRNYRVVCGDTQAGSNTAYLTSKSSPKKEFGVTNLRDNTSLRGSASGNPSELLYYHLFACAQNEASNPSPVDITVVIDYLVLFGEPNDLAGS